MKSQKNWITYLAGFLSMAYGAAGAIFGLHNPDSMADYIIAGLGIIGFRRAMAKSQNNVK